MGIAALFVSLAPQTRAQEPAGFVAAQTELATPWYTVESGRPGPTVMIVGGVHGNEPAGSAAAEQILHWKLECGRLVVLPRANRPGLEAGTRWLPGAPRDQRDLNRNFPREPGGQPCGLLAGSLWELVLQWDPDWLLDLHEGYDFHRLNRESVGSTVIAFPEEPVRDSAESLIRAVDATIEQEEREFSLLLGPARGSLARAVHDELGIPALTLESTSNLQSLSTRTRQHRILVHRLLEHLGMARSPADTLISRGATGGAAHVALYDGTGILAESLEGTEAALARRPELVLRRVGPADLGAGVLAQFDALIVPGGSSGAQARALGEAGRAQVRTFTASGGGYLGLGGGALLAATGFDGCLGLVDARALDGEHPRRGRGPLPVELTERGARIFGEAQELVEVLYANGPILAPAQLETLPDFEALALYRGELTENGAPGGVMPGTPAALAGIWGEGRVLLLGVHPEQTEGREGWISAAVHWVTGRSAMVGGPTAE